MLLPDTDESGAKRIAETVHTKMALLGIASAGIGAGAITVSIGLAAMVPSGTEATTLTDLYRLADGALYEAKQRGRNRTWSATSPNASGLPQARVLQLVQTS